MSIRLNYFFIPICEVIRLHVWLLFFYNILILFELFAYYSHEKAVIVRSRG